MKKTGITALALLLIFSLSACGKLSGLTDLASAIGGAPSGTTTMASQSDLPDIEVGEGTSCQELLALMREIKTMGDRTAEMGLPVQSEYYYSFAGASVSAIRYAAEYVLWLRGEGESLASLTASSRYVGWDTIAEINYASPYPSYFEGLLLDFQGKHDESIRPYTISTLMPMFPEEGLDFSYFKTAPIADLYAIRDSMRALEDEIYAAYTPTLTGREWDRYLFYGEYARESAEVALAGGDYNEALYFAKHAVTCDPYDALNWRCAAMCALAAEEPGQMGAYIEEGLLIFPEDEGLLMLLEALSGAVSQWR